MSEGGGQGDTTMLEDAFRCRDHRGRLPACLSHWAVINRRGPGGTLRSVLSCRCVTRSMVRTTCPIRCQQEEGSYELRHCGFGCMAHEANILSEMVKSVCRYVRSTMESSRFWVFIATCLCVCVLNGGRQSLWAPVARETKSKPIVHWDLRPKLHILPNNKKSCKLAMCPVKIISKHFHTEIICDLDIFLDQNTNTNS